jgi:CBS domain-containing protein
MAFLGLAVSGNRNCCIKAPTYLNEETDMLVHEVMTRDVCIASPDSSLQEVAQMMAEENVGCLPVGENDQLIGMITDRDIAIRAVAQAKAADLTAVREIMSHDVKYCFEDDDIANVAGNMGDVQLHRLPVVNRRKRLVGIVALADIANFDGPLSAGRAVCGISYTPNVDHGRSAANHN